ncbi:MAG: FGGY family carbohydrate kinase [Candidatus Bathyarchaeia archaeon]
MPPEYLMAIDCGSGGVKCFIVDASGRIAFRSGVEWERDGWNTRAGWLAIRKAVRKILTSSKIDPKQIAGVSTTSMREEFVLLDNRGREVTYEITPDIYPHGDELNRRLGEMMYRVSGHWPVPGWIAAAKMAWLRDKHPEVLDRVRLFLMISDWAGYMLGGTPYTDGSSACETSLFDVKKGAWAHELLDELDLPAEIFPRPMRSGTLVSTISAEAAKATSLVEGTSVVVGGADTQCGLLGCGATREGDVVAVGGTTTPVQMVTNRPVFDEKGRTWTNMHAAEGRWIIESNAGRTGWVYRWFRDNILGEKPSPKAYEVINNLASVSPAGSNGVSAFLGPHVFNSGPPYWEGDRLGDIPVPPTITGSSKFTRGDLARAIIEANCYAVRANLEQLAKITGLEIERLGFCGGNSKSELWNRVQATVVGKPVVVPVERDASAVGAAMCAAVGARIYNSMEEAMKAMVHLEDPVYPDEEHVDDYNGLYHKWLKTRQQLSGNL